MTTDISIEYGLEVIAEPSVEPISTDEAIAFLREDFQHAQTDLIEMMIKEARQWAEEYLCRALIETEFTLTIDGFGGCTNKIYLPRSKVSSVDAVRYLDTTGTQQTLSASAYRADTKSLVSRVSPAYSLEWPDTYPVSNAVEIDFTAGYGESGSDVPEPIRLAMLYLIKHRYDNRDAFTASGSASEVPMTVKFMLGPYRVRG